MTAAETALERDLSGLVMRGVNKPEVRRLDTGDVLTRQGDVGGELFLVLDGVLVVDVDGTEWAEVGPGAVLGERAAARAGSAHVDADGRTACKVAVVPAEQIGSARLAALAAEHRREAAGADA